MEEVIFVNLFKFYIRPILVKSVFHHNQGSKNQ